MPFIFGRHYGIGTPNQLQLKNEFDKFATKTEETRNLKISVLKTKQEFALEDKVNELLGVLKVDLLKLQDDKLD